MIKSAGSGISYSVSTETQIYESTLVEWNKLLIELAPGGFLPQRETPRRVVLDFIADQLGRHRLFGPEISRPDWLTDSVLARLEDAAGRDLAQSRAHAGRLIAPISDQTKEFLEQLPLREELQRRSDVPLGHDFDCVFLYYEAGEGLPVHVDSGPLYEFNLLIPLTWTAPCTGKGSATYFVLSSESVTAYRMTPGLAASFHASTTPHGRIPLSEGERTTLLLIGFGRAQDQIAN